MLVLFVEVVGTALPTAFYGACLAVSAVGFVADLSLGNAHLAQIVSRCLRWAWSLGVVLALAGIVALAMIAEQLAHEPRHRCPYCDWLCDSRPAPVRPPESAGTSLRRATGRVGGGEMVGGR